MARSILVTTSLLILTTLVAVPVAHGQAAAPSEGSGPTESAEMKKLSDQLDRTLDQYMTWLTQIYQMDPDQQEQVRTRLQQVKKDHLGYGSEAAAQMVPLQQELRFYIEKARKGEPVDKETIKDLQNRLTAVIEKAPMTFNNVILQTEKLLPDDQVLAGRERQREFKDRMHEFQERAERQAPPAVPSQVDVLRPYIDTESQATGVDRLPPPQLKGSAPAAGSPVKGPAVAAKPAEPARTPDKPIAVEKIPLDAWGKYVEDFIAQYKLDGKQAQQCQQILKELRKRADEYRLAHKEDYKAAEQVKELPARNEQISQLDKPVREMFTELKTRLDNIPTDAQRKLAAVSIPASQPAKAPASRPVVPAKAPTSAPTSAPASAPAKVAAAPK